MLGFAVRLDVEVGKHDEENDGVKTNPNDEQLWIVAVWNEEQLKCMNSHQDKLRLQEKKSNDSLKRNVHQDELFLTTRK